jgi:hypothetical protein
MVSRKVQGWGIIVLLVVLVLAGLRGEAPRASADEAPALTAFKTAHVSISGTITAQGQQLPVQGEGDIDAATDASHLTIGLLGATFETIVTGGRTYVHSPTTNRWEYSEGNQAGGFNFARLAPYDPATIRAAGRNFTRVGPEEVAGAPTTHWRADVDYARLLGIGGGSQGGFGLATNAATMELWIGATDTYLHKLSVDAQGRTSDPTGTPNVFQQALTLTFSNFDAPVNIVAPAGAVPAGTPAALASPPAGGGAAISSAPAPTFAPIATPAPAPFATGSSSDVRPLVFGTVFGVFVLLGVLSVLHRRSQRARARALEEQE